MSSEQLLSSTVHFASSGPDAAVMVGAYATGGTATSGAATGADPDIAAIFKHGSTGNGNSVIVIGESNAVGEHG